MQPKVELLGVKVKARINLTADDWQFYSIPGRNLAARRLNRALEKMLAKGEIGNLGNALSPFAHWGACDSEGYQTLSQVLRHLGIDDDKFF